MKKFSQNLLWGFVIILTITTSLSGQQARRFCIYSTILINATDTVKLRSNGYVKNVVEDKLMSRIEINMEARGAIFQNDTLIQLELELKDMKLPDSSFMVRDIKTQKNYEFNVYPGKIESQKIFLIKDDKYIWFFYAVATTWFEQVAEEEHTKINKYDSALRAKNLHDTAIHYSAYQELDNKTGAWSEVKQHNVTIDFNVNGLRDLAFEYPDTTMYLKYFEGGYVPEKKVKYGLYLDAACRIVLIERKSNSGPAITYLDAGYVYRLFSERIVRETMQGK